MGGRGNCCIIPYAADNSFDRIMLRFRPIAPKPAPSVAVGGSSSASSSPDSNKGSWARCTGGGRRYVSRKRRKKKKKKIVRLLSLTPKQEITATATSDKVTLPLLPPPYYRKGNRDCRVVCSDVTDTKEVKPNFMPSGTGNYDFAPGPMTKLSPWIMRPPESQLGFDTCNGSWARGGNSKGGNGAYLVVECVTNAWVDGSGKRLTDEGRMRSLRDDTSPCFISDGVGRVRWLNEAFRRMVAKTGGDKGGVAGVWLVMREAMTVGWSFACRVRMVCTWRGMKISSMTSPCDVWRMEGGDFAWRLDVGAALRLSL